MAALAAEPLQPYEVGDAIPTPLTGTSGDPARGRTIVLDRRLGACLLCHTGPFPEDKFQGTLAPDLTGAGSRWSAGQLRLRLVDATRLNADTIMPPYYRVDLTRVGAAWRGEPILSAEQLKDVVAFISTLREGKPRDAGGAARREFVGDKGQNRGAVVRRLPWRRAE